MIDAEGAVVITPAGWLSFQDRIEKIERSPPISVEVIVLKMCM